MPDMSTTEDSLLNTSTTKAAAPGISTTQPTFLIWGTNSWIASHLHPLLQQHPQQPTIHSTTARLESRTAVLAELTRVQPTHVFNCAGVTGRPNVDWCEDHQAETLTSNVVGAINLAVCCQERGVHLTVFGTGCEYLFSRDEICVGERGWEKRADDTGIYTYDETHPPGGAGYTETDPANFSGSFYSLTKAVAENYLSQLPLLLLLRLRMPTSPTHHPRSFLTKITSYSHILSLPNSHTMLHDLLPAAILLATARETGVYNFTNPGCITHNEVLALYKEIVCPGFVWRNFDNTVEAEEQSKVLKAGRSNCALDVGKLVGKMREYGERGGKLSACENDNEEEEGG
ncbi:bifunctional dTDP-4-dehydrorhamnose 3,5-epimerase/dTDP-4-dehydrorhamnose reductase [Physcia stellaris]|nr:bifunctional dTDP-4-dehydrorhamnose 3,5-epimerase/dTDP-4-dehydrorhamnose reductase [Physcia stellaris]